MFKDYEHHAQYYETDQMGCVHHSNYIRWMEEARVNLMEQMGCGYKAMEASGIMSPVLEVHCQYRSMVRFDDHVKCAIRPPVNSKPQVRAGIVSWIRKADPYP